MTEKWRKVGCESIKWRLPVVFWYSNMCSILENNWQFWLVLLVWTANKVFVITKNSKYINSRWNYVYFFIVLTNNCLSQFWSHNDDPKKKKICMKLYQLDLFSNLNKNVTNFNYYAKRISTKIKLETQNQLFADLHHSILQGEDLKKCDESASM